MSRNYLQTLLIQRFGLPLSFGFLLFGSMVCPQQAYAQSALFFTREKVSDLRKLQTATAFTSRDTIYGAAYVSGQNTNDRLEDFAIQRDGNTVFPITVTSESGDIVRFEADLSSGINKPKKKGFMGALSSSISNPDQAFYFQVLPTSKEGLTTDWIKLLANLYHSPKPVKILTVSVGTGESFHTLGGKFALDFSGGSDPYANWTAQYVQEENHKREALEEEKVLKSKADSIEKIKAAFDETVQKYPPSSFKNTIVDAKLEKELRTHYTNMGYEVDKVCIIDAENSSTFLVWSILKDRNDCFLMTEWLERQNPYGNLVKFIVPEHHGASINPLRCEEASEYLK
jgi:hypothetical protein